MIRLLLMRHANALDGSDDRSRPLSDVGLARARRVVLQLKQIGWLPTRVIYSDARRCCETVDKLRSELAVDADLQCRPNLYLASPETIGQSIRNAGGDGTLMMVAHNPGLSMAASNWSGKYHSLSPASVVYMTIDAKSFADASPKDVQQVHHLDARTL